MDGGKTAGNAIHGGRRVWVPLAVIAVLLGFGVVEAVAAKVSAGDEELAADTVIDFGAEGQVSVRTGEGWALDEAASDSQSRLILTRGDMTVRLVSVQYSAETSPAEIWEGFDGLFDIDRNKGVRVSLGDPATFETPSITGGLYADVRVGDRAGRLYMLPAADRTQAVEVKVLAPPRTDEDAWDAATAMIASINFDGEDT